MESFKEKNKSINKIPIIIKKKKNDSSLTLSIIDNLRYQLYPTMVIPELVKCKFLVPKDLTVAQFIYVIRKRLNLSYEKSIIIYFKNSDDKLIIYPNSHTLEDVYNETGSINVDKFLYAFYIGENTFG